MVTRKVRLTRMGTGDLLIMKNKYGNSLLLVYRIPKFFDFYLSLIIWLRMYLFIY